MSEMVLLSTQELFASYTNSCGPNPAQQSYSFAGIIGFTGEKIRGTIILATVAEVLQATRPTAAETDSEQADWAGELANQLLGRIKNKLLAHGLVIQLSTPTSVTGESLRLALSSDARSSRLEYRLGVGPVAVTWATELEDGFTLQLQPKEEQGAREGEMHLF